MINKIKIFFIFWTIFLIGATPSTRTFKSMSAFLAYHGGVGAGTTVELVNYYEGLESSSVYFKIDYSGDSANGLSVVNLGGNKRAKLLPNRDGLYTLESIGMVEGELGSLYSSLYYSDLSTIRIRSKDSLYSALTLQLPLFVPPAIYELEGETSDSWTLPDEGCLSIQGVSNEKSKITFFPKHGRSAENFQFFLLDKNATVDIRDIHFDYPKQMFETYNGTLNVGSDSTKIQITESLLRTGFVPQVGQVVYTGYNPDIDGEVDTIFAYDSGTKTITLTGELLVGTPDDQVGKIGFTFPDSLSLDTVLQYGEQFYEQLYYSTCLKYSNGTYSADDSLEVSLKNVKFTGWLDATIFSGGNRTIKIDGCDMSAQSMALGNFNNKRDWHNHLYVSNTEIHGVGMYNNGSIPPNTVHGAIVGGAFYGSPGLNNHWNTVQIHHNLAQPWRQYSSSRHEAPKDYATCTLTDCHFWENGEYNILLSESVISNLLNCTFEGNGVNIGLNNVFTNCSFKDSPIVMNSANQPFNGSTGEVTLKLIGCDTDNMGFETGWSIVDSLFYAEFIDCNIDIDPDDYSFKNNSNEPLNTIKFTDCLIGNIDRDSITHFNGVFGSGDLANNIILNNCKVGTLGKRLVYRTSITGGDWKNYKFELNNCEVDSLLGVDHPNSLSGIFKGKGTVFNDGVSVSAGRNNFSQREGYKGVQLLTNDSLIVDWKHDYYAVSGDITTISMVGGDNRNWTGKFMIEARDSNILIEPYSINTSSNAVAADTILKGTTATFFHRSDTTLAGGTSSTSGQVLFTADGVDTEFDKYSGTILSGNIVPGSVQVTTNTPSAIVLLDSAKDGILYGAGGSGFVDYHTRRIYLLYDTAPSSGDITVDFDEYTSVHHEGVIIRIK